MNKDRMRVEFKDYYQTLGVSRTASAEEIKKAFRNLARQYHPDVAKDKKSAEAKFKEINEAYEVLGDPEKRRKYDDLGANWKDASRAQRGRPGGGRRQSPGDSTFEFEFGGTGFSDFFEQFFGRRRTGGQAGSHPFESSRGGFGHRGAMPGSDIEEDILVTLAESLQGSIRTITLRRENPTTGETDTHTFRVRIPAGVLEGQMIRVPGHGELGTGGAAAGDLYLRVRFERHPEFEVRGSDLLHELDLAPWEAVLGTEVRVPTLEGSVALRIPAGTQPGQQLRVRGKGLSRSGQERGDLYVTVGIQLPKTVNDAEKAAWENLAKSSSFKPR